MNSVVAAVTPATDDLLVVQSEPTTFFPVSLLKLTVLSFCTVGLYDIYWFYKNWKVIKLRDRSSISPALRSLFGVFFCYSLFKSMDKDLETLSGPTLSVGGLAAGWILLILLSRLPDPYWIVTMFSFLFLLPIQSSVNRLNQLVAPEADINARFGAWNIATVIVGGIFVALAIIGTFMPPEPI